MTSVMLVSTASNVGGMERVMCGLARHLPKSGYSTWTYVPDSSTNGALLDWCRDQGVDAVADGAVSDAAAPHTLGSARAFRDLIRRVDPDIVNLHYGDNFVSLWDVLAARLSGRRRKVVVSVYHPTPWATTTWRKRIMTAVGGRLAHEVTTCSRATEDVLVETPIAAKRIARIPCGIAIPTELTPKKEARARLEVPDGAYVIVSIARLVDHKGLDLLIGAVDDHDLAGSVLLIVGDGPMRPQLEQLASTVEHVDVRILGRVGRIDDVLAAADVFALPSLLEGFGLVYVEAAMYGVPSVATNVGGIPDAVVDNETGILVEPESLAQVRAALVDLRRDPAHRQCLGDAAGKRARAELSDVEMSSRFAALFDVLKPSIGLTRGVRG